MKPLAKMSPADRAKRIAQLTANPGTRAAVPDKYLPAQYRQQRQMNRRLNAPVTAGSSLTNRDLSRSATSATQVKYGDAERQGQQQIGQSQQTERDTTGWYDAYLKELAQHQTNIAQIGESAVTGVKALAGADQAPAVEGLSTDNAKDAGNAAAVRRALLANIGGTLTAQGANANSYADTLAHVVGPGQKLTAQAQARGTTTKARDTLAALVKEKGAYRDQVMSEGVADEQKNVLAQQALGLDITKAADASKAGRAARREARRHNQAQETAAANDPGKKKTQAELDFFNKHGYWPSTGPPKKPKAASPYLPQASQNAFKDQFDGARTQVESRKALGESRAEVAALLKRGRPAQTVDHNGTKVKVPAIPKITNQDALTAALDAVFDEHLSPATVKKLHGRKIKVNPLGVSTKRPPKPKPPAPPAPVLMPGGVVSPLGPVGVR